MIALYVKTHRKTGLKYLGQTVADPYNYKGSGVRWLRHLIKHGNDVDTDIIRWCKDKAAITAWGIFYSDLFDVVNDPNWANLKREEGAGGWDYVNDNSLNRYPRKGNKRVEESLVKGREIQKNLRINSPDWSINFGKAVSTGVQNYYKQGGVGSFAGKKHTTETIDKQKKTFNETNHQQGDKNSQYGTRWITNGIVNTKISKDLDIPIGWTGKRIIGLPSLPKEDKEKLLQDLSKL